MNRLLLALAITAMTATAVFAQSSGPGTAFFGPFSPGGFYSSRPLYQYQGAARPINVSPTTGRTYSTEADYKIQRRNKRPPKTAR
jgi:hypothetical protein